MLSSLPVDMCIIGHSERRAYHQESDDIINRKLQMLLATGIKPVFCIGETLEQREADETMEVVITQLESCLHEVTLETGDEIVIAYEPVWAIGTGVTATPEQAQEVHSLIRRLISKLYSSEIAEKILIIYGGSMKPSNMDELLACHDIDGGLIGGASLELDSFCRMIEIAIEKKRGV
jgi:triosephosphate isomerase